ncbi:MAG TPA: two-component regulator propeller domain-containing protein [Myxococcaceae bacterium]|jgi:signal transduction histidine kinase/ligand-binding sensor domain-containing protein/ActR/RegA family two-component response regulator
MLAVLGGLLLGLGVAPSAQALEPSKPLYRFLHHSWQTKDGLPQSSIMSLAQTPDGYLWAGTQEGLVRFDGVSFTTYNQDDSPALKDNLVRRLEVDQDGTLWIATGRGLTRRSKHGTFQFIAHPAMELRNLIDLEVAHDGSVWIATFGQGVFQYSASGFRHWTVSHGLANPMVAALAEDEQGSIWVGSNGGLQRWDGATFSAPLPFEGRDTVSVRSLLITPDGTLMAGTELGEVYRLEEGRMLRVPEASLPGSPIVQLFMDRAGSLWVGSRGHGMLRLARGQRSVPAPTHVLSSGTVFAVFEDREGNLWLGTDGQGLHRFKDTPFTSHGAAEGLVHDAVMAVHEGKDGSIWLATQKGISRWQEGQVSSWTTRDGLLEGWHTSIAERKDGSLWFGTLLGVSRWQDGKLSAFTTEHGVPRGLRTLHEDAQGTLWLGTSEGLVRWNGTRFEPFVPPGGLPGHSITLLRTSGAGGMWIGTESGGLAHLEQGQSTVWVPENGPVQGEVLAIHEDPNGALWIGTTAGLFRWKEGHASSFSVKEGLFNNRIFQIVPDEHGFLWMSCNKGVFRVALAELDAVAEGKRSRVTSRAYGSEDGMRSEECNGGSPAGMRSRDGRLWFPTLQGVAVYTPQEEPAPLAPPPVLIEEVRVDERIVPASEWDQIPVGNGRLEIRFTSPGLRSPERLLFRHQLVGLESGWSKPTALRDASYTLLPPGHYRFRVVAESTEGGPPSPPTELAFYLKPRFYQTVLFRVGCVLAIVLVVAGGVLLRLRQLKKSERELQKRVAQHTAELASVNVDLKARLQELQTTRERLAHAEKMAAVGTLAAGVGHEINNPLAFIISNLHYAAEEVHQAGEREGKDGAWAEDVEQALREALDGADRVRRIVQDLKAFSRMQPAQPQQVNLQAVLDLALSLADVELRHRAVVVKDYLPGLQVLGDETRLGQVFLNLLVNAAQAIPEGHTRSNEIRITTRRDERGQAVVSVSDTGSGISPEVLPRIFEPFFTTKPVGMGTGLGLSICHSYVQAMGGEILVQSELGHGTTFEVMLPSAQEDRAVVHPLGAPRSSAPVPRTRLMVIDDEPLLATALSRMLTPEHEVDAFASARQALERLRSAEPYALILCDLMMPEMTGMELYATLRQEAPELAERMVFLTGGAFTETGRAFLATTHLPWLEKPFEPEVLRARVRQLLEERLTAPRAASSARAPAG